MVLRKCLSLEQCSGTQATMILCTFIGNVAVNVAMHGMHSLWLVVTVVLTAESWWKIISKLFMNCTPKIVECHSFLGYTCTVQCLCMVLTPGWLTNLKRHFNYRQHSCDNSNYRVFYRGPEGSNSFCLWMASYAVSSKQFWSKRFSLSDFNRPKRLWLSDSDLSDFNRPKRLWLIDSDLSDSL